MTDQSVLRRQFPWAKIFALDFPLRLDSLHEVLEEIRASSGKLSHVELPLSDSKLVGVSDAMKGVVRQVEQVATSNATVLLTGESGTGKEVIARRIHELSERQGEFVAINCGAIPEQLLESELFGHERGAFTGAAKARAGKFEQANGGTFFLDEIGDMPSIMQVKLLRVLEERVVERVGGTSRVPIDVRIIAATHRDLAKRIETNEFREDLFYRLSVFPIEIAPLRERTADIQPLIAEFVRRMTPDQLRSLNFSDAALACLEGYEWPGNIRELSNLIERLLVTCPAGRVDKQNLPWPVNKAEPQASHDDAKSAAHVLPRGGVDLKDYIERMEQNLIEKALAETDGVVQKAADMLEMGRTTLVEKIRRHKIREA
ncbi:MAG TPA: sigma 54-interacting transcriptional regulator [Woeseiaceae bacterium]|nr:sigma 54-interacting transcriptional regulator [Woeseiaceae bacterium]